MVEERECECVRLGEDPCIERAPQLSIRRGGVMPAKVFPSCVVIKKDRFARSLARAEAFSLSCASHCHVPPWFRRQLPLGHEHWRTGQSRCEVQLFRGTSRFHKATNKPLLKKKTDDIIIIVWVRGGKSPFRFRHEITGSHPAPTQSTAACTPGHPAAHRHEPDAAPARRPPVQT